MPVRNQVFPYGSSSSSTPSPPRALVIPKLYVKVISLFMFYSREHKTAQCCFLCRKLSIGKFKFQISFSFGSFVSGKNIWNALSLSCIYFCVSWLQAHKTRTSSNLIRKGHDVTNMLRTNLLDEEGWSWKTHSWKANLDEVQLPGFWSGSARSRLLVVTSSLHD